MSSRHGFIVSSVALACALTLGGCASGPTETEPTPSVSPSASSAPVLDPTPQSMVPLAGRLLASVPVPSGDGLTELNGSVFVKTDPGNVVRIDPATNAVTGEVRVDTTTDPGDYCTGIGNDGSFIWACSAGDDEEGISRIDPVTLQVIERFPVGKSFDQLSIPFASGAMWVLSTTGTELIGVAVDTGETTSIPLDARCGHLAAAGDQIVASCPTEDTVLLVDVVAGEVTVRESLNNPQVVAATEADVWTSSGNDLVQLDPTTLKVCGPTLPSQRVCSVTSRFRGTQCGCATLSGSCYGSTRSPGRWSSN